MSFLNQDNFLAKANAKIIQLESKLERALTKIDGCIFENKQFKLHIDKLTKENRELKAINKILSDKIDQLEKRIKINSSNSNLPPSSNLFVKPTISNREKSNKNSGGQNDHEGNTIKFLLKENALLGILL